MWNRNNPYEYSDPSGYCTENGTIGGLKIIGCVHARPVPPEKQLMPNGMTVGESVANQRKLVGGIVTAAAIIPLPIDAEAASVVAIASRTDRHHIVAQSAAAASAARGQLARFGIAIHDKHNLVTLERGFHQQLHTDAYYRAVDVLVGRAGDAGERRQVLQDLSSRLQGGWSPK